jgi:hypothetical protein
MATLLCLCLFGSRQLLIVYVIVETCQEKCSRYLRHKPGKFPEIEAIAHTFDKIRILKFNQRCLELEIKVQ